MEFLMASREGVLGGNGLNLSMLVKRFWNKNRARQKQSLFISTNRKYEYLVLM
jgi:hypothetical protein